MESVSASSQQTVQNLVHVQVEISQYVSVHQTVPNLEEPFAAKPATAVQN